MPISNFRVKCVADEFLPGTCAQLYAAGDIEFPDAVAGTTCKRSPRTRPRSTARIALAAFAIPASCKYGQALGEAERPLRGDELARAGTSPPTSSTRSAALTGDTTRRR